MTVHVVRTPHHGRTAVLDGARPPRLHVHRYHRVGDDWFSNASLYRCRCGVVRPIP